MKNIIKKILISILQNEAKLALKRHSPFVIAVVGSVGKTSTKDAVAAALSPALNVRKSKKSYNSDIGIPLTILGLNNPWSNPFQWILVLFRGLVEIFNKDFPEILVMEVGADHPGDISELSSWLKTDIIVATQFAKVPVHIENFPSREAVLQEKLSILKTLKPDGYIIANSDDEEFTEAFKDMNRKAEIYTYGLMPPAYALGSSEQFTFDENDRVNGFTFKIECESNVFPIKVKNVLGDQHKYPILAGFTVAKVLDINTVLVLDGLSTIKYEPGRMRIIEGVKDSTIIDDSYNSSPIATRRALEAFTRVPSTGKKIAILGEMLELGKYGEEEHKKMGGLAASSSDILVAVGKFARDTAEGALVTGMDESYILQFENAREAGKYVEHLIEKGDLVLIKGSQGTRMEKAVIELMAHPEDKEKLLARQEEEWSRR
ncbi:MAG: UDP-N-acetylmuramoyl-tripeptide--D-alanyl-D-alanine ligase [Candidatus Campbellbacteria bacterium]|nr:UDP-N-acetylmuramoyl-tripeptide--D-alanyl-D-alanine ligase [Candidatus Campbellbacteria bacterium]